MENLEFLEKKHYNPNFSKHLYLQTINSPLGKLVTIADDGFLYSSSFLVNVSDTFLNKLRQYLQANIIISSNDILDKTKYELELYFSQKLKTFTIPTKTFGTEFQMNVWQKLQQIPYGQTISYLELAEAIGNKKAFRAVANANGKNPLPIIIPCHRVINSNGNLGGFTGGTDKKILLLNTEQYTNII